jgi:hypothetical protein
MMFGSESYNNLYHQKHTAKGGVPSQLAINNQKPFQSFGAKMPRTLLSNKSSDALENQIAQLWKTGGNNDSYTCTEDIWKFCPTTNITSDYSSLSSASQSPEDHTETFFNVASQVCIFIRSNNLLSELLPFPL